MKKQINQSLCRNLIFLVIIVASFTTNKPVLAAIPEPSEITVIYPPKASDATQITTTSFQANWSSVKGASSYKLTVSKSIGKDLWSVLPSYNSISISGTSHVVTGLSAGTRYAYIVKSVSLSEIMPSDPSNIIEVNTTPEPPVATFITNLTDNFFVANWDASTGAISYKLYVQYRQYIPITQTYIWRPIVGYESGVAVSGTSYTVSDLSHSTNYRYSVKAIGSSAESDYSNSITVQTLPGSTVATAATEITATSFTANWESQTWADSYTVMFYSEPSHVYFDSRVVETNSVNLKYLSPGTSYSYVVKVNSGEQSSPYSNSISVSTIPPAPVAITETDLTHNSFKANWNAADGATSYLLRVVEDETQGYILEDYETTDLFATVSGLQTNSLYHYAVKAKNSSGVSAISNWIHLTTKPAPPVLNQPTNITTSSISLSWSAVSGATGYKLYSSPAGSIMRYQSITLGDVTNYSLTGLETGKPYNLFVTAINVNGESLRSNILTDVYTALVAPIANEATNVVATSFQANWTGVISATAYRLYVYEPGPARGTWVLLPEFENYVIAGTEFQVTGLSPNSGYRYGLKSIIGSTSSDISNYIFVTTTEAAPVQNTVSLSAYPSSMGSVSGAGTFNSGTSVTVTATPSSALYRFVNWTEGALIVSANASYTFTLNGNRTLVANFEVVPAVTYTVGLSASPANEGTVSGGGTFTSGTSVTVSATPSSALYRFENWTEGAFIVSTNASYTFTINSNRSLVANFEVVPAVTYTVALSASPANEGTVSGGGIFESGESVTVTATAEDGYDFINWTENGAEVSTSESYTFTIARDRDMVANFEVVPAVTYTVALSASPANEGTVSGGGIFESGESVTVTATAEDGYDFINWTENGAEVSTSESYTFTIARDRDLVANFEAQVAATYTVDLSASPSNGGTVEGDGTYDEGESVTVTATAEDGYDFVNWTEDGVEVSTSESYTFTIERDRDLVANFEAQVAATYTVDLSASPSNGGTVEGDGTYDDGESVTVTATAEDGYDFVNWTEDGAEVSTSESYTFTIARDRDLVANFEAQVAATYTVDLSASPSNGGTVEGDGTYDDGESVTVTATAEDGYDFVNWAEDGVEVSTSESYTFTIARDRDLVANFEAQVAATYTVDLSASPSNGGTVEGDGTYDDGESVTVTATAEDGYDFVNWTEDGAEVSSSESYTFTIARDRDLVANFEAQVAATYTVDLSASPSNGGTVEGEGTYDAGESVTVTANQNSNYTFVKWTENDVVVSTSKSFTFTAEANRSLVANFEHNGPSMCTLKVSATPAGAGIVIGSGSFETGSSVTVSANANDGYKFVSWSKEGVVVSVGPWYTFSITDSCSLVANFIVETGVDDIDEITMLVYPNPTTGIVHVSGISEGTELNVSDISGRIVHSVKAGNSKEILDLSSFRHGVYFIKVNDKQFHLAKRIVLH